MKKLQVLEKGSGTPNSVKVACNSAQVQEIAETKHLNAANIESAMRMIEGTARSSGIHCYRLIQLTRNHRRRLTSLSDVEDESRCDQYYTRRNN